MSGGRKINDHGSWMGMGSNGNPLSQGVKMKYETSAEGAGELMKYEDTTEAIRAGQVEAVKKIKSRPMKQPDYRN